MNEREQGTHGEASPEVWSFTSPDTRFQDEEKVVLFFVLKPETFLQPQYQMPFSHITPVSSE